MAKPKWEEWTKETGLILIKGWARDGLTNEQIAHNMGISRETLRVWCKDHSVISAALKESKDVADINVENALYKSATGYTYTETKVEIFPDGSKKGTSITKYVPPNPTSIIYWLNNRKPDDWRNKRIEQVAEDVLADDGLFDALAKSMENAKMQDDSDMLPKEDTE